MRPPTRQPLTGHGGTLWAAAVSVHQLADLTARWIAGDIQSKPGYHGPCDVDEAPDLKQALIALNRAGLLTEVSQEGFEGPGYDGAHWQQLAALDGFCDEDTLLWLSELLTPDFMVVNQPCRASAWGRVPPGKIVTRRAGEPYTWFGCQMSEMDIADCYEECSAQAIDALCTAWQVTIYDPVPGRNTLWPLLRHAAEQRILATTGDSDPVI